MALDGNYYNQAQDASQSLETLESPNVDLGLASQVSEMDQIEDEANSLAESHFALVQLKRRSLKSLAILTPLLMLVVLVAVFYSHRNSGNSPTSNNNLVANLPSQSIEPNLPIPSSTNNSQGLLQVNSNLKVDGQLQVGSGNSSITIKAGKGRGGTLILPAANGTLCLSTNNCNYVTPDELTTALNSVKVDVPPSSLVNGINGAVTLQGASNQVIVTTNNNGQVTLSLPQGISTGDSPRFSSLLLGNNLTVDGNITTLSKLTVGGQLNGQAANFSGGLTVGGQVRLSAYNCSVNANGGKLTTDAAGNIICADDSGGASSTITGTGTTGKIAYFTGPNAIGDSLLSQSGSTVTVAGILAATNLQGDGSGVTNVNAATLQGHAASYFTNAGNLSAGTVPIARLDGSVSLLGQSIESSEITDGTIQNSDLQTGSFTNITGVGTITAGTWNADVLNDAYVADNLTINSSGTVDWQSLSNYPAACSAGEAVTSLGDTLTCQAFLTGSAANGSYVQLQSGTPGAAQTGNLNISGTAIADVIQASNGVFSGTVSGADGVAATDFVTKQQLDAAAGGAANSGVTKLNNLTGALTLQGNTQIGVDDTSTPGTIKLSIQANQIGNTELAFDTGQNLTINDAPKFAGLTLTNTLNGTSAAFTGTVSGADGVAATDFVTKSQLDNAINGVGGGSAIGGSGTANTLAMFTGSSTLGDSILVQSDSNSDSIPDTISIVGTLSATNLQGNGSGITNLDASALASGTVPSARLTGDYTGITAVGTLSSLHVSGNTTLDGTLAVNGAGNSAFTGTVSGANATANNQFVTKQQLDSAVGGVGGGSPIGGSGTNGTIAMFTDTNTIGDSILTQSGTTIDVGGTLTADFLQGDGGAITNLNGSNIATGTVANARLTGNGEVTVTAGTGLTGGGVVALGGSTTLNVDTNYFIQNQSAIAQTADFNISGSGILGGTLTVSGSGNSAFTGTVSGAQATAGNQFVTFTQAQSLIGGATGSGTKVSSLNGLTDDLTIQGSAQIGVDATDPNISLSIKNDSIDDTQLKWDTGQNLTVSDTPKFAGLWVTGNVGIGTDTPGYKLDVAGTANALTLYQNGNQVCDNSGNCAGNGNGGGATNAGQENFLTKTDANGNLVSSQIYDDGTKISIGSTTPGYNLQVNGTIQADGLYQGVNQVCDTGGNCGYNGDGTGAGVASVNTLTGDLTLQTKSGTSQILIDNTDSTHISFSIQADSIDDTQLKYDTGQNLTVSSTPTFAGLNVNGDGTFTGGLGVGGDLVVTDGVNPILITDGSTQSVGIGIGGLSIANVPAPANLAATPSQTGGALSAATYTYTVSAITSSGETAINQSAVFGTITTSTGKVTVSWDAVPGAIGYKLYRTTDFNNFYVNAVGNVTSVVDDGSMTWTVLADISGFGQTGNITLQSNSMVNLDGNSGQNFLGYDGTDVYLTSTGGIKLGAQNGLSIYDPTADPYDNKPYFNITPSGSATIQGIAPNLTVQDSSFNNYFTADSGGVTVGEIGNPGTNMTVYGDSSLYGKLTIVNNIVDSQLGYSYNGTAGSTIATCTGTDYLQGVQVKGGIVTSGTCAAIGGTPPSLQDVYNNSNSPATILLANAKDFKINAADTATDPNILFNLQCSTSCGSNGRFAIQDAGVDVFTVKPNGDIVIGTAANNMTLAAASNYEPVLNGSAQHTKTILLTPEFAGAVLDATKDASCTSANSGTMTAGYDDTNQRNYYDWTSSQTTSQCYDVVVQVPIPADFSSWSSTAVFSGYTSSTADGFVSAEIRDTANSVNSAFSAITSGTGWADTNRLMSGGTWTPGKSMTIRFRMSAKNGADVRLGNILLTYKSKY